MNAVDIKMSADFKFNNDSMWYHTPKHLNGFNDCYSMHANFSDYIKDQDKLPISLKLTQ